MSVGQEIAESLVCHCFEVTEQQVRGVIAAGTRTVEDILEHTSAGGGCTACHYRLRRLLAGLPPRCRPPETCTQCGVALAQCACQVA